jgi:hypothetical protein
MNEVKCPECGQLFPSEHLLSWHRNAIHPKPPPTTPSRYVGIEIERIFQQTSHDDEAVIKVSESLSDEDEIPVLLDNFDWQGVGKKLTSFRNDSTRRCSFKFDLDYPIITNRDHFVEFRVLTLTKGTGDLALQIAYPVSAEEGKNKANEKKSFLFTVSPLAIHSLGKLLLEYSDTRYRFLKWSVKGDVNGLVQWEHLVKKAPQKIEDTFPPFFPSVYR